MPAGQRQRAGVAPGRRDWARSRCRCSCWISGGVKPRENVLKCLKKIRSSQQMTYKKNLITKICFRICLSTNIVESEDPCNLHNISI